MSEKNALKGAGGFERSQYVHANYPVFSQKCLRQQSGYLDRWHLWKLAVYFLNAL